MARKRKLRDRRQPRPAPEPTKRLVEAGNLCCPYCEIRMVGKGQRANAPTRDHINPRARGGGLVVITCHRCNNDKDNYSLAEWRDLLRTHNDYRWKIVDRLIEQLSDGVLQVVTADVSPSGFARGVFA